MEADNVNIASNQNILTKLAELEGKVSAPRLSPHHPPPALPMTFIPCNLEARNPESWSPIWPQNSRK